VSETVVDACREESQMAVRAIRGATQLERDDRDHLLERVSELMTMVLDDNDLDAEQLISVIFTATDDVRSEFPAYAARRLGLTDVPLLCARELEIEGSLPRIVRVMVHVDTDLTRSEVTHVYLHGAASLRRDLARVASHDDASETPS
jgi:chorismate mutase